MSDLTKEIDGCEYYQSLFEGLMVEAMDGARRLEELSALDEWSLEQELEYDAIKAKLRSWQDKFPR